MRLQNLEKPAPFIWRFIRFSFYKLPMGLKNYVIGFLKAKFKIQKCNICGSRDLEFVCAMWAHYFLRCSQCNIYFVSNLPNIKKIRQEYLISNSEEHWFERGRYILTTEDDKKWEEWIDWKIRTFHRLKLEEFEKKIGDSKKALEIGCAEGKVSEILKRRGWTVVGLDLSEYMVHLCQELNLNVIIAAAENLNFKNESFDLTVMFHTLEHTVNPLLVLRNVFKVLKRRGRLILEVPYFVDKKAILEDFANIPHFYFFTEKAMNRMSNIIGFNQLDKFIYEDQLCKSRYNICYLFEKSLS